MEAVMFAYRLLLGAMLLGAISKGLADPPGNGERSPRASDSGEARRCPDEFPYVAEDFKGCRRLDAFSRMDVVQSGDRCREVWLRLYDCQDSGCSYLVPVVHEIPVGCDKPPPSHARDSDER